MANRTFGINYNKRQGRYTARVTKDGVRVFLGYFDTESEAISAHDNFVRSNEIKCRLNLHDPEPENLIPNTRLIRLTQGKFAIVDEEDFERVNQYTWAAHKFNHTYYASRHATKDGKKALQLIHRFIMGEHHEFIDHKNGEGLFNAKSNLRSCTKQENQMNQRSQINCTSIYKGVCWDKKCSKFMAYISKSNRRKHLGYFTDEIEAAKAYNKKAIELFGEFARLNEF